MSFPGLAYNFVHQCAILQWQYSLKLTDSLYFLTLGIGFYGEYKILFPRPSKMHCNYTTSQSAAYLPSHAGPCKEPVCQVILHQPCCELSGLSAEGTSVMLQLKPWAIMRVSVRRLHQRQYRDQMGAMLYTSLIL